MNCSRKTLISDRHKNREAEPKDYDISVCPDGQRKLLKSTYKYFGTHLETDWGTTTQLAHSKRVHEVKDTAKSMVQADCFHSLVFDRKTGISGTFVLSCYQPNCNANELITTYYALDYVPPHFPTKQAMQAKELTNRKLDFRRRQSQFTDVADHRRWGWNTWQDFNDVQAVVQGVANSLHRQINLSCP
ncbi:LOW QUALITY PROTEIN: cilia- and flagella-associated protein 95-like [Neoarius graeffei]|uniref:LOW QUALITY PROTEIN: cilia- and flagella-associated protein 95-like n=1 Tax=Neoarius graeffei TaxID=443677 RepID=UPI00298C33E3|nr:LOW QUALITY PROTEIN: cilia- and flagella-associated protein 95-like [Neoarius graeffei]